MVGVGATSFYVGSHRGEKEARGARPVYEARLPGFCIDRTEVTVAEYKKCVEAGMCSAPGFGEPDDPTWIDKACNQLLPDRMSHPANCVDWKQANDFCRWAGKRLPNEEEWQLAAGRMDGREFAWGDAPPAPDKANLRGADGEVDRPLYLAKDGWEWTAPVGSFPADKGPFGTVDMGGNVSEWTSLQEKNTFVRIAGGNYNRPDQLRERATVSASSTWPMLGVRCARQSAP